MGNKNLSKPINIRRARNKIRQKGGDNSPYHKKHRTASTVFQVSISIFHICCPKSSREDLTQQEKRKGKENKKERRKKRKHSHLGFTVKD